MSDSKRNPELELQRILAGLADSLAELPDEALLAEMREAGEDPVQAGEEVRKVLGDAVKRYRQRHLRKARDQYQADVRSLRERTYQLPMDIAGKRELLGTVLARHPQYGALTAQWRDLKSISDADLDSILEQLAALGALDELPPRA